MTDGQAMTCKELVELVTDYLEGALPPDERARFEHHLAGCPHCREYLAQMRLTIDALGRLPASALPVEGVRVLLDHFRGWTRG